MVSNEILIAISSAFIGAFSTLIVQEIRAKREKNQRIKTLRKSLHSEVYENNEMLEDIENPNAASGNILSLTAYESVSDEIGLLGPSETGAVIRYYNRANEINSLGKKIEGIPQKELRNSMTHHVALDSWRRARRKAISNASTALEQLEVEEPDMTDS